MRAFLPVLAASLCVPARAGRPFATEDAAVLEQGGCEWENVAARSSLLGEPRQTAVSNQVGCGVGSNPRERLITVGFKLEF